MKHNYNESTINNGKVYLVGAGPGNPDYLTVKALRLLKRCDVLLYDMLIDRSIVELSSPSCKRICVGTKHGTDPSYKQEKIDALMLSYYKMGKIVVRLKSGDPFIFGRGGEEIEFLRENNVPYEIVPGLTSAISVPSSAGIPLTHRDYSSAVLIISGHRKSNEMGNDWKEIAKFKGTIVVLMGVGTAAEMVSNLICNGMDRNTGVAIVENGTKENQRTFFCHLEELPDLISKCEVKAPSIIVIGKVINALLDRGIFQVCDFHKSKLELTELIFSQCEEQEFVRER
ncbi:MAG: uroporphyrinogen-III C-methyltransferase [Thermoplasmatales archaeon]